MINVMYVWVLQDAFIDSEEFKNRDTARVQIDRMLRGLPVGVMDEANMSDDDEEADAFGVMPSIVYDENGKPRPARVAYDKTISDDHPPTRPRPRRVQPLPPETVPTDDYDNPFPGLAPPLG